MTIITKLAVHRHQNARDGSVHRTHNDAVRHSKVLEVRDTVRDWLGSRTRAMTLSEQDINELADALLERWNMSRKDATRRT